MKIKWQINPEILSSKIGEEVILMSMEAESYFGLDAIATRIWQLLSEKPSTIDELVVHLLKEFEINEITCKEDVIVFINELSSKKLIQQIT